MTGRRRRIADQQLLVELLAGPQAHLDDLDVALRMAGVADSEP